MSTRSRVLLLLAFLFHLSLLVSWRAGFWNRFTFDSTATHGRRGWDFYALYQAGHNVLTNISVYESDNDRIDVVVPLHTPYRYLPFPAYTLGVLLNSLSPLWAFRLWVSTVEVVLLSCAYVSYRLATNRDQGIVLAAMWLCFTPYYLEIYLGQFSLVQGALILAMMLSTLHCPSGWRYDLAWVLSLLWKQNTGLFIPLFLRLKRWRTLILATSAILVTSLPYFALYPSALAAFGTNFSNGLPSHQLGNLGVRQFLFSLTSALPLSLSSSGHVLLQRIWVLAVLVCGLWLTFRRRQPDVLLHLCFWSSSYFLIYHHVWEHHYVLLLPVYMCLYRRTASPLVLCLYALTAIWTPYILIDPQGMAAYHMSLRWTPLEPRILDVCYHACKAVPTLLLWGYIARLLWRSDTPRQRAPSLEPEPA